MKIEEIKEQLKSGDIAGAAEAAEELLKGDPDNVRALMLFGTCQQLLGDNAAFELTHETVREAKSKMSFDDDPELAEEWAKFDGLYRQLTQPALVRKGTKAGPAAMKYVVIAVMIAAAVAVGIWLFGSQISKINEELGESTRGLYADPPIVAPIVEGLHADPRNLESLYAGPSRDEPTFMETFQEK